MRIVSIITLAISVMILWVVKNLEGKKIGLHVFFSGSAEHRRHCREGNEISFKKHEDFSSD